MPQCTCGMMNSCTCHLAKKLQQKDGRNKLIQFLMGLNSSYGDSRNQILATDLLPSINKAYYLIQHAEKPRKVADAMNVKIEAYACAVKK